MIPWPEELGVNLGGPGKAFSNACQIATDILASGDEVRLVVLGHQVRFQDASRLLAKFHELMGEEQSNELCICVDGQRFRAARVPHPSDSRQDLYCFRLLVDNPEWHKDSLLYLRGRQNTGGAQT